MSKTDIKYLIESLHPFEVETLLIFKNQRLDKLSVAELSEKTPKLDLNKANRAISWLKDKNIVSIAIDNVQSYRLTTTGAAIVTNGFPEDRMLQVLATAARELSFEEIRQQANLDTNEFNISLGTLKKKTFIQIGKNVLSITDEGKKFVKSNKKDQKMLLLEQVHNNDISATAIDSKDFNELLKRNLIELVTSSNIIATLTDLGQSLLDHIDEKQQYVDKITPAMLESNDWVNVKVRPFNVEVSIPPIIGGKRNFYLQALDYVRQIWLGMGFKEMEGPIVQTAFWNFDTLFVPQDHPAREAQDTFYVKHPLKGTCPNELYPIVAAVHETGGNTGSLGWGSKFSRQITETLLLRPHTTCLSSQTIYKIKKEILKGKPAKFFAVGRCFRNEKIDWKHLAEFDQVEGIVVDPNVTFPDLLGYLKEFFKAMGFPQARFRPSFYPYTEPSVGIDVMHPIKKEWYELGGAGLFRPEVVMPLLGQDIPVLAWGPGISRIVVERYNITDIRQSFENDLKMLTESPLWMR